jgi:hypothetical protein
MYDIILKQGNFSTKFGKDLCKNTLSSLIMFDVKLSLGNTLFGAITICVGLGLYCFF